MQFLEGQGQSSQHSDMNESIPLPEASDSDNYTSKNSSAYSSSHSMNGGSTRSLDDDIPF
jgi:hypothetical protein